MKFKVDLKELGDALGYVSDVLERRFTYPILTNVLIDVDRDGQVRLRGTDHDMTLIAVLEAEDVVEPGAVTIPGRRSLDVVNSIGVQGSIAEISTVSSGVLLKVGRSDFLLATMPVDDFPPATNIVDPVRITLTVDDFMVLLRAATSSMAQNNVRRQLNGTLLELTSTHIRTVATDGMMMCVCTNTAIQGDSDSVIQVIVPRKAVLELVRGFGSESGSVTLSIGSNAISVEGERRALTTNYVDSKFPPYQPAIPQPSEAVLKCSREALERAIRQAATLSDEGHKVYFNVERDTMKVSASTEVGDRADVVIPVDYGENSTNVIFRHDRIRNMLASLDCEVVSFHIRNPTESVRVDSEEQENVLFVVSPIRG
ncbi:MAG: DNA polymerase III subunit beta [Gammaproteobacteria bacterium]|nr:DNA polymerase III subunit beta [Gammaproteobacteria bacterium]